MRRKKLAATLTSTRRLRILESAKRLDQACRCGRGERRCWWPRALGL